jgi:hypothetical protein
VCLLHGAACFSYVLHNVFPAVPDATQTAEWFNAHHWRSEPLARKTKSLAANGKTCPWKTRDPVSRV